MQLLKPYFFPLLFRSILQRINALYKILNSSSTKREPTISLSPDNDQRESFTGKKIIKSQVLPGLTFGIRRVGEGRLVGDVLPSAQQIVLDDRSFVLELPPEPAMIVLQCREETWERERGTVHARVVARLLACTPDNLSRLIHRALNLDQAQTHRRRLHPAACIRNFVWQGIAQHIVAQTTLSREWFTREERRENENKKKRMREREREEERDLLQVSRYRVYSDDDDDDDGFSF